MAGYAYLLTHPGVPCVFWPHLFDWGDEHRNEHGDKIRRLIRVRKDNGINSRSVVNIRQADDGRYAAVIDDKVAVKIGPGPWSPGNGWQVAVDGADFAVWTRQQQ